ncbi:MAG TPA: hypothetical protein VNE67_07495 [Acetobacteraceae bacterium]|nr:hypothetical protein [Acetobacteraceae bacterium]
MGADGLLAADLPRGGLRDGAFGRIDLAVGTFAGTGLAAGGAARAGRAGTGLAAGGTARPDDARFGAPEDSTGAGRRKVKAWSSSIGRSRGNNAISPANCRQTSTRSAIWPGLSASPARAISICISAGLREAEALTGATDMRGNAFAE